MTESMVYWIAILDNLRIVLWILGLFLLIFTVILTYTICEEMEYRSDDDEKTILSWIKFLLIPSVLLSFLVLVALAFIPNTKQATAIYIIPQISNNEQFKQIPDKLLDLGNSWLDELKPEVKKTN